MTDRRHPRRPPRKAREDLDPRVIETPNGNFHIFHEIEEERRELYELERR